MVAYTHHFQPRAMGRAFNPSGSGWLALLAALVLMLSSGAASAQKLAIDNLVINGGFENVTAVPKCTSCGYGPLTKADGWNYGGGLWDQNYVDSPVTIATVGTAFQNGNFKALDTQGAVTASPDGGNALATWVQASPLTQDIVGLIAGDTYDLTFYYALAQVDPGSYGGTYGSIPSSTGGWTISLGGSAAQSTPTLTVGYGEFSGWMQATMSFIAGDANDLLSFQSFGSGPPVVFLDGISLTGRTAPAVPEPATWAMMVIGFGVVGASDRRRRTPIVAA